MHETAYNNNVTKIKHAIKKLADVRQKITKYDAELKMSRAEAEMAKLATSFDFDVTTDFGQIEQVINDKISLNRAKARVAADLSERRASSTSSTSKPWKPHGRAGAEGFRGANRPGHARDRPRRRNRPRNWARRRRRRRSKQ